MLVFNKDRVDVARPGRRVYPVPREDLRGRTLLVLEQSQQQMVRAEIFVTARTRRRASVVDDALLTWRGPDADFTRPREAGWMSKCSLDLEA